jgi:hypothetical protein
MTANILGILWATFTLTHVRRRSVTVSPSIPTRNVFCFLFYHLLLLRSFSFCYSALLGCLIFSSTQQNTVFRWSYVPYPHFSHQHYYCRPRLGSLLFHDHHHYHWLFASFRTVMPFKKSLLKDYRCHALANVGVTCKLVLYVSLTSSSFSLTFSESASTSLCVNSK